MIQNFAALRKAAIAAGGLTIAVAAAEDEAVIEAVIQAQEQGLAEAILVGDEKKIYSLLEQAGGCPQDFRILDEKNPEAAAAQAVRLVHDGEAAALLKGFLGTAQLMHAVLNKEYGLRSGKLISHCMLYELPAYPKFINNTDGGMLTFPSREQKIGILENAARLMQALGYEEINAALLCGAEKVDPRQPDMVDAEAIAVMKEHWQTFGMNVYGPVGLDLALSLEACAHKHYEAKGAGEADIVLVPDYQVGNAFGKTMSLFGQAMNGGIILGAKAPVLLVSRADPSEAKLNSIALAAVAARSGNF